MNILLFAVCKLSFANSLPLYFGACRSWLGERDRFIFNVNVLQRDYSVRYLLPIFRISTGNAMD